MLQKLCRFWRDYQAGGDASRWHFADFGKRLTMRRFVNGRWEYRDATEDERNAYLGVTLW